MLNLILQILSVLGTILLVLLLVIIVLALLVLFFPITYRFNGSKEEEIYFHAKAKWLFGLLRADYGYPQNKHLKVKFLWFVLYDKQIPADAKISSDKPETKSASEQSVANTDTENADAVSDSRDTSNTTENGTSDNLSSDTVTPEKSSETDVQMKQQTASDDSDKDKGKILQKTEKIKYTISSIYDKIKEIWANISYYVNLLQEENTKELFAHVCKRLGKIFKSIRPRHLKADLVFGTGSPDTTGYAYGIYGMLLSVLGPGVILVPDFEQAIFKGIFSASGHITIWVIVINVLKVLFDKKLHLFLEKIKAGPNGQNNSKK